MTRNPKRARTIYELSTCDVVGREPSHHWTDEQVAATDDVPFNLFVRLADVVVSYRSTTTFLNTAWAVVRGLLTQSPSIEVTSKVPDERLPSKRPPSAPPWNGP